MAKSIHETAILLLQRAYPDAQTTGFRKAIQKLQWDIEGWADSEASASWDDFLEEGEVWKNGIIPDLWFFDAELMSVVCIEVEHTSIIDDKKFEIYKDLWWHLDNMYWELHLLSSDRWCNLTPIPVHRYTSMGTVDLAHHRAGNIIRMERDKNETMFELSKIYCLADPQARTAERCKWAAAHPGFTHAQFRVNRSERSDS